MEPMTWSQKQSASGLSANENENDWRGDTALDAAKLPDPPDLSSKKEIWTSAIYLRPGSITGQQHGP